MNFFAIRDVYRAMFKATGPMMTHPGSDRGETRDGHLRDGLAGDNWHLTGDIETEQGKGDPFAAAIRATRMSMIITDPRQSDNPIVFANNSFLKLSGYSRDEVIGTNCRFLQGPDTKPSSIAAIRDAVADRRDINIELLNYRKDGTPFWNALFLSPVVTEDGELQFFFSSQIDVTDKYEAISRERNEKERFERAVADRTKELQQALNIQKELLHEVDHRVKNNLQMIASLIVMQSRAIPDEAIRRQLQSMLARVEALSTVHRRLYQSSDVTRFDVADFVRELVLDLIAASGRDIQPHMELTPIEVSAERASSVSLIVNELVTNAIKHGFRDRNDGNLFIRVAPNEAGFFIEVQDDGEGLRNSPLDTSFGTRLIRSLSKQLGGSVSWDDGNPGTKATVTIAE